MSRNVILLVFSDRNHGNCANIAEFISNYHSPNPVKTFQVNGIAPCGSCDYECLNPSAKCPNITDYQNQIMDSVRLADLVYYIIPNFCGFPCANYFAFNERSVGYFNMDRAVMNEYMSVPKKFIMVSNSENEHFKAAAAQQTNEEPDILYLKSGKYRKRSTSGDLMNSEEAQADLRAFLDK